LPPGGKKKAKEKFPGRKKTLIPGEKTPKLHKEQTRPPPGFKEKKIREEEKYFSKVTKKKRTKEKGEN